MLHKGFTAQKVAQKWIDMRAFFIILFGSSIVPHTLAAQQIAGEIASLQQVLDQLYQEMVPMCSSLIGVGQGIAGFAALWYIGSRVWRHIARAESIDFYPLFRPFVLGFCVLFFPGIIALVNAVLQPVVDVTRQMVGNSDRAITELLKAKEQQIKQTDTWQMYVGEGGGGDRDRWYRYTYDEAPSEEGMLQGVGNDIKFAMAKASYSFRNSVKEWLSEVLRILFEAAALCINTLRTFQLIVLAILGPLVIGLSVFDGFGHLLRNWLARYMHVYLWLPVANIFGSIIGRIQENMLKLDLSQLQETGDTFFSRTDMAYLIFLIIGIIGYFTVPTVAGYVVSVGMGDPFSRQVGATVASSAAVGGAIIGGAGAIAVQGAQHLTSMTTADEKGNSANKESNYMRERMKGNE